MMRVRFMTASCAARRDERFIAKGVPAEEDFSNVGMILVETDSYAVFIDFFNAEGNKLEMTNKWPMKIIRSYK